MLHRRNVRHGQGRRVGNRNYEARKGHENHGDCGSPWIAALGQHARGEPSRSPFGAAMFRLLHDRSQAEENLIGDRAYDSDPLDAELRKDGIEMIAPHRGNRSKPPTQDRRRLSRYMRRWLVERFFAWIQWQRRILIRWEYHAHNFLGFVQLACLVILFKQF